MHDQDQAIPVEEAFSIIYFGGVPDDRWNGRYDGALDCLNKQRKGREVTD